MSRQEFECYQRKWETEGNVRKEKKLDLLFCTTYPHNTDPEEVREKLAKLNRDYSVRVSLEHQGVIAGVICELSVDEALSAGDIGIVESIVTAADNKLKPKGEKGLYYSLVTKYCAFHKPTAYCLFDHFASTALMAKGYWKPADIGCNKDQSLRCYPQYHHAIEVFRERSGYARYCFRAIDHYLWYKGKEIKGK